MPPQPATPQKTKKEKTTFRSVMELLAAIAGALGLITLGVQGWERLSRLRDVELPDAYAHEHWREAEEQDSKWLVGSWYFPTVPGFTSGYRFEGDTLYQQNASTSYTPEPFRTEWIACVAHVSDKGLLRLTYPSKPAWGASFYDQRDTYVGHEFERSIYDDGTVESSRGRQMLNRDHCTVSEDGITYHCK